MSIITDIWTTFVGLGWLFMSLFTGIEISLGTMSLMGNTSAGFFYRLLMSYFSLILCAIFGVWVSITLRLVGLHRVSQWATARAFKYTMLLTTGVEFEVIGGHENLNTRPAVFVGNHQTALDVLLLACIFPQYCSVTAKKSLKKTPFLGWFMALSGTVFIDRTNRLTAMKAFEGAAKEMKDKRQSVFIFPEGTRSNAKEPTLLGFKKGAFHLAIQAGVPIVPIVAATYGGILDPEEWRFRRGTIPVIVLPPIPTDNLDAADVDNLLKYTRDRMLKALVLLTKSPRGQMAFRADPSTVVIPPRGAAPAEGTATAEEEPIKEEDEDIESLRVKTTTGGSNIEKEVKRVNVKTTEDGSEKPVWERADGGTSGREGIA